MDRTTLDNLRKWYINKPVTPATELEFRKNFMTIYKDDILKAKVMLEKHTDGVEPLKDPIAIRDGSNSSSTSAQTVLGELYARGLITLEEYETMLAELTTLVVDVNTLLP